MYTHMCMYILKGELWPSFMLVASHARTLCETIFRGGTAGTPFACRNLALIFQIEP